MESKSIIIGIGIGLLAAGIICFINKNDAASNTVSATNIKPLHQTYYKNDETMDVWRNKDGYIMRTQIKRDAKTGG